MCVALLCSPLFGPDLSDNGISTAVVVGAAIGGVVVIVVAAAQETSHRARAHHSKGRNGDVVDYVKSNGRQPHKPFEHVLKRNTGDNPPRLNNHNFGLKIPLLDIKAATNNFDERHVIGSGGFGKVYRGENYKIGCVSFCITPANAIDGACSGVSCYQASLPTEGGSWPIRDAIFSAFSWHNKMLNVWTHFGGFLLFFALTLGLSTEADEEAEKEGGGQKAIAKEETTKKSPVGGDREKLYKKDGGYSRHTGDRSGDPSFDNGSWKWRRTHPPPHPRGLRL